MRTLGKSDEDMVREDEFPILKAGRSARYERPRTDAEEARMRVGREVERRVARRDVGLMRRLTRGGRRLVRSECFSPPKMTGVSRGTVL